MSNVTISGIDPHRIGWRCYPDPDSPGILAHFTDPAPSDTLRNRNPNFSGKISGSFSKEHMSKPNQAISGIISELRDQCETLKAATDNVKQAVSALADNGSFASWKRAATLIEQLTVTAAKTSLSAAATSAKLAIQVMSGISQQQEIRLVDAIEKLNASLTEAGSVMASSLTLPWPASLLSDVTIASERHTMTMH